MTLPFGMTSGRLAASLPGLRSSETAEGRAVDSIHRTTDRVPVGLTVPPSGHLQSPVTTACRLDLKATAPLRFLSRAAQRGRRVQVSP